MAEKSTFEENPQAEATTSSTDKAVSERLHSTDAVASAHERSPVGDQDSGNLSQRETEKIPSHETVSDDEESQKQNQRLIQIYGRWSFYGFITILSSLIALAIVSKIWPGVIEDWLGRGAQKTKGPLWFGILPHAGTAVAALVGGWLWSMTWLQKQQTNRIQTSNLEHQKIALVQARDQFIDNQTKDNQQFQRRMLEERFNRILDDFASQDPAVRAGAASRLASIAKELNPEVDPGAPISEHNNPYYIHSIKQLARRLIMDDSQQVGSAIQDALADLSDWTKGEAESAKSSDDRREIDQAQADLINVLADTNRTALSAWLDAFAGFLIERNVHPLEESELDFDDNLMSQILEDVDLLPSIKNRANWCDDVETYLQAIRDLVSRSDFQTSYRRRHEDQGALEKDVKRSFGLATQQLLLARDTLANGLTRLPIPANLPAENLDPLEHAEEFGIWERQGTLNLSCTFLQGARLNGVNLQGARLDGVNLQGAELNRANLQGANLTEAKMQRAALNWANLQGASLTEAKMQRARLDCVNLQGATLNWANLQGAELTEAKMQRARLNGANLLGAELYEASLLEAFVFASDLLSCEILPIDALRSEFRDWEWDKAMQQRIVPDRPLNKEEQTRYDAVVRKLVEQGDLSEAEGKKLIGKSLVGKGAVTIDKVLAERDKAAKKATPKAAKKADGEEPEPERTPSDAQPPEEFPLP